MLDPHILHYQSIYSASLLFQNQHWHFCIFHRPLKSAEELESLSVKHSSACLLHSANAVLFAFLKLRSFLFLLCFRFVLLIGDIHLQSDPTCCAKRLSRVPSGKTTVLQGVEKIHVPQASSSHAFTLSAVGAVLMNQRYYIFGEMKGKSTNLHMSLAKWGSSSIPSER